MTLVTHTKRSDSWAKLCLTLVVSALVVVFLISNAGHAAAPRQESFASPEDAVKALVDALKSNDTKALSAIFGPDSRDLVFSGDPVADKTRRERFVSYFEEKNRLEEVSADKVVLHVGDDDWPFPIPVVKRGNTWRFDPKEGREEILARRIGRNELSVIQVCLAYVDAQREYASKDRNGDGLLEYAQRFGSTPGKHDGLYWKAKEGEEESPLGPLAAEAVREGYSGKKSADKPIPYKGYYYKILKGQGKDAPGGAYSYVANGKMIGGFAMVAYPATYGSSGIMTFLVNHDGIVYQKDLGKRTEAIAAKMTLFNPDKTWKKVDVAEETPGPSAS
ncbi:MAG TPA: DUF2950 domain-containing protein [Syntrophobacteria bacterium]|nr:DUF2950 domain-containing protein [Syntrophobacteria bacterium]